MKPFWGPSISLPLYMQINATVERQCDQPESMNKIFSSVAQYNQVQPAPFSRYT